MQEQTFHLAGAPALKDTFTEDATHAEGAVETLHTAASLLASGEAMLSFVIPLFNEEDSLADLYARIKASAARFAPNHEIIFVDDGSRDTSYPKLKALWHKDPCVSVLHFRRNQGKAAGLSAGFSRVRGQYVVMMDADLQDQPEEIPAMIACMDKGFDLVTGWKQRRHDPLNKTLPSKLFNGTVSKYFKLDIHDFNCGLKIMKADVAKDITLYGDFHRFIPVLAAAQGYKVTECVVEHAPRVHGVSKYGAKRLITGMLDFTTTILVTKFYHKPLQMFGPIGLGSFVAGIGAALVALIAELFSHSATFQALWSIAVVLMLGGGQIFCTGLMAELFINAGQRKSASAPVQEELEPRGGSLPVTDAAPVHTNGHRADVHHGDLSLAGSHTNGHH